MSDIKTSLRRELQDPEYAEGYAESFLNAYVATQIKVIREQQEMTQSELASAIGTTQAGISRIENVNYSSWSMKTLKKLARAFELRVRVSFEPYGTLPDEVVAFQRESLERVKRTEDPGLHARRDAVNIAEWKALHGTGQKTPSADGIITAGLSNASTSQGNESTPQEALA